MRSFFNKTMIKSNLEISIEWNQPLNDKMMKRITLIHVDSFLDVYKNLTELQLGLATHVTKRAWLTKMIQEEIEELKTGAIPYACIYINDEIIGFVTCDQSKPRHDIKTAKQNQLFKNDVYIRLLAIKPSKYLFDHYDTNKSIDNYPIFLKNKLNTGELPENIRTGLGRLLVESVDKKFPDANALTLDTRLINTNARKFYEHIGFTFKESITFGGSNPNHYVGYEQELSRSLNI